MAFSYDSLARPMAVSNLSQNLTQMYNFQRNIIGNNTKSGFSSAYLYLVSNKPPGIVFREDHLPFIENYSKTLSEFQKSGMLDSIYFNYYKKQYDFAEERCKVMKSGLANKSWYRGDSPIHLTLNDSLTDLISYYFGYTYPFNDAGFEKVANNSGIPDQSRKLMLFSHLRFLNYQMLPAPEALLNEYYNKYTSITHDTLGPKILKREYPRSIISIPGNLEMKNTLLLDPYEKMTTLRDVVKKNRNKVIYIDIWASWCMPCMKSMAAAYELRKSFKDNEVIFIYLAFNDKIDNWKEAIKKSKINQLNAENYFIIYNQVSDFLSEIKLNRTPRYIIIDKLGEIVNLQAPEVSLE